ncbi:MAG: anhydro-N-acetylmuramic acid kinase, partial [Burkholderiales bacterium]
PGADELARAARAANALADLYAQALARAIEAAAVTATQVAAVGAHGQTVRHRPEQGYTLQLLNAARLAERAGVPVVADLRSRDVAAGGQGAPLAPAFHAALFAEPGQARAIVNLGGIANVTWLAPAAREVTGFDTGPGNLLMDAWCARHLGQPFDRDGHWAGSGRVDDALLQRLLDEPYFATAAPKSTGRDLFDDAWLDARLGGPGRRLAPEDVQATLLELTARTVAEACRGLGAAGVFVCGGGAHNRRLLGRLGELLHPAAVRSTAELGLAPETVEAVGFAWLAHRHLLGAAGNLPAVTGAGGPRVLGALYPR